MTMTTLFLSVIFGAIGMGLFTFGKHRDSIPHLVAGIALIACPYVITNALVLLMLGVVLTVGPFLIAA